MIGQIVSSICQIHNTTGGTLTFKERRDYNGQNSSNQYPNEIQGGYWEMIVHSGDNGTPSQSVGAVVYRWENPAGDECDWLVSWSNKYGDTSRKVYTEIREKGHYENDAVWPVIRDKLSHGSSHSEDEWNNLKASVHEEPYKGRDVFPIFQGEIETKVKVST
ncbi:23 kDa jasmonate-induced protein-like [Diospyros lotus]|uniref:23 kDa jasmonate-induced protein-like n=1 Tax=Diospyros lotus TaxID=55363 RepID=UPI0022594B76|nr:23 kDa jasmonate-induced protein-like [Diospyros lotus]